MKKIVSSILMLCVTMIFCMTSVSAHTIPIFGNRNKVLVLMYHKISENSAEWSDYCIPPSMFEQDIKMLKSNGYEFMTATQLADSNTDNRKIAVITFDDGYDSDLKYALPILEKYNANATFFIIGSSLGKSGHLTENDVYTMAQSPCVEIGNHSYASHNNTYGTLQWMYGSGQHDNEIIQDYNCNTEYLKKITGKEITSLSYPNGLYSGEVDERLKRNGMRITFSTKITPFDGVKWRVPVGRWTRNNSIFLENLI